MHSALSWRPQAAQTLLVRPRRVHMHTPRRRAPAGRPASLPSERGEKERLEEDGEETTRGLLRAVCLLDIRGHEPPRNTGAPRSFVRCTSFPMRVLDIHAIFLIANPHISDVSLSVIILLPFTESNIDILYARRFFV